MKGWGNRTKVRVGKKGQEMDKVRRVTEKGEGKGSNGDMWRAGDMELCGVATGGGGGMMRWSRRSSVTRVLHSAPLCFLCCD